MSPGACKHCGQRVYFTQNWRGVWTLIDPEPPEWTPESYLEVRLGEFISVFRHKCEPPEPAPKVKRGGKR